MRVSRYLSFLIGAVLLLYPHFVIAEDFEDFAELDLEAMLNIEVVSASKRPQKLLEAPNAMYVITREDIERSGAVDLADLFRMVPGVDVAGFSGNTYGVSARGFNDRFARRMLVLIDGRSIYTMFNGGVFWELEQVFLEDIKQIEVIRGPGASLWGANAVNGVISIITKDPQDDQGLMLAAKTGTKHFRESVARYSDDLSNALSMSLTAGYREDGGTRGVRDFRRVPKVTGRLKYVLSDDSVLHFFTGFNDSDVGAPESFYSPSTKMHIHALSYQMLRWEHQLSSKSRFHLQAYHDNYEVKTSVQYSEIEERTYGIELQHSFSLGTRHQVVWGLNYRRTRAHSDLIASRTDHDNLLGIFVQNEIKIFEPLKLVAGLKYENNSFTGGDFSPRICLLYAPWQNHQFRAAFARAYRTPAFVDKGINFSPLQIPELVLVSGNRSLDPEEMTAFELGYRTILFHGVSLNVELYYNDFDRVMDVEFNRKGLLPLIQLGIENRFNTIAKGVEVTLDIPVKDWWTLAANYTYQEVNSRTANEYKYGTPKHKFNFRTRFTLSHGFSFDATLHFVDDTEWVVPIAKQEVDDYLRLDVRIAQKFFSDRLELALAAQNLTDQFHPEAGRGFQVYDNERLVFGQVTLSFK